MKLLEMSDPFLEDDAALTIGMFDGVHAGHQKILSALTNQQKPSVVLTFKNHPLSLFSPEKVPAPLCSLDEKLRFFEALGITYVYLLTFTKDFSQTPYDLFLKTLHQKIPFSSLILGKGAKLGFQQQGTEENVTQLGKTLRFETQYIEKLKIDGNTISSTLIRQLIEQGELEIAETYLQRNTLCFLVES